MASSSSKERERRVVRAPIDRLGALGHFIRSSLLKAILQGTQVLVALQRHRTPTRNKIMFFITAFGHEDFFTAFIPLLTWIIDPRFGFLFTIVLAASFYSSGTLKNLLVMPRPPSPPVEPLEMSSDWGTPSLHTITAVVGPWYVFFYTYLNYEWSQSALVFLFCLTTVWSFSVIFSRLYLGVHSPLDVVVGGTVGCLVLVAWLQVDDYFDAYVAHSSNSFYVAFCTLVFLTFLHPRPSDGYSASFYHSVILLGLACGVVLGRFRTVYDIHLSASLLDIHTGWSLFVSIVSRVVLGFVAALLGKQLLKKMLHFLIVMLLWVFGLEPVCGTAMVKEQQLNVHYSEDFCLPQDLTSPKCEQKGKGLKSQKATIDIDVPLKFCLYSLMGWLMVEGMPVLFHYLGV